MPGGSAPTPKSQSKDPQMRATSNSPPRTSPVYHSLRRPRPYQSAPHSKCIICGWLPGQAILRQPLSYMRSNDAQDIRSLSHAVPCSAKMSRLCLRGKIVKRQVQYVKRNTHAFFCALQRNILKLVTVPNERRRACDLRYFGDDLLRRLS